MGKGKRVQSKEEKKSNKGTITLVVILIILILALGALFAMKFLDKGTTENENDEEVMAEPEPVKRLQIVDEDSTSRPYAVMINNNHEAWPQCGLQDAYLVYEIITEGGITRMMALFKDKDTAKIGSIRSARHYFLDYAQENDAIFVHWGGSERAYSQIKSRGINDIDGIYLEGSVFFRDKTLGRSLEHTGFTSMENVKEYAENHGQTRNTNKDLLLNYSVDEIDLSENADAEIANNITIKYSNYHTTSYEYDEENKVYLRSMSGKKNIDLVTEEQYTAKNIIVYQVKNYSFDSYGRQELENLGDGTGYYITDGYAIPIKWEKLTHEGQTIYTNALTDEELIVNDGNTFIQIYPESGNLIISE